MIIGIDGNEANVKGRVGIGEYAFELLQQFSGSKFGARHGATQSSQNTKFIVYLKEAPVVDLPKESENWEYRVIKPGKFWTQWRLPFDLYLHKPRPDVFFTPSHYAPRFSPIPTVISVMDLSFLYFPKLFNRSDLHQLRSWTAYSVKNASQILTISNSSKNDIIKEYNLAPKKVRVAYPGVKDDSTLVPRIYSMKQLKEKYGLSDKYILFVGTLQPRKNIVRLIEAFSKLIEQKEVEDGTDLVIVGKRGWLYEEILNSPKKFGIEKKVKFLEDVDNQQLSELYSHALCFVLPSLYEGFGLPVLEAMKHNCPVITSKVSSLPEAGGEACLYVDPEDADDIAKKIAMIVNSEKLRQELIEKGKKQVGKFSWEKTAKETLQALEEVVIKYER